MPPDANSSASTAPTIDPADEIRGVFEKLNEQYKIPDVLVFRAVFEGTPVDLAVLKTKISRETHNALGMFLRDVTTCPPEVLAYAKELLLEREHPLPPLALETSQPAPAIAVTKVPTGTYMNRVPNPQPHPTLFGPNAPENFDAVKSS